MVESHLYISPELIPATMEFERHLKEFKCPQKIRNIIIKFGRLNGDVIGLCEQVGRIRTVTIDRSFWKRSGYEDQKGLIFHELGHCILDRDHEDGVFTTSQRNKSLMSSYTFDNWMSDEDYYLEELFSGCSTFRLFAGDF